MLKAFVKYILRRPRVLSDFSRLLRLQTEERKNNKKIVRFYVLINFENKSIIKTTKGEKSYGKQKEICLLHAAFNV